MKKEGYRGQLHKEYGIYVSGLKDIKWVRQNWLHD